MRRAFVCLVLGAATWIVAACDRTSPDDFEPDLDAGPTTLSDGASDVTDAASDVTSNDALVLGDGFLADGGGRCPGSTYTTAPGGGACDPERIRYAQGRGGHNQCFAPTNGTFCDVLQVSVFSLDASSLPPGFVCGSAELGVTTCRYPLTDGGTNGTLDDASIAAACAVTAALPQSTVSCIVYD
ncbi:MAG: hypothetical protein JWM74_1849 [Myxococcaceae bacterium]|jgi:hypothetical protein|nr:hypothetical protein [Myxococcaceae bacterium]